MIIFSYVGRLEWRSIAAKSVNETITLKNRMMADLSLLHKLKHEAPQVPRLSCEVIDQVIDYLRACKGCADAIVDDSVDEWAKVRAQQISEDLDIVFEQLEEVRDINDKLRTLGKFWYTKMKGFISA